MPVARHAVRHHTGQQRLDARSINVDIRVLSATNIDLETSLAQGRLRRYLFYRLASVTLRLPPLRDRQSDIPILLDYYIKQFSKSWLIEPPHLSASVLGALCNHDWPGNIRELENVIEKACILSNGRMIMAEDIELPIRQGSQENQKSVHGNSLRQQKEDFEKEIIRKTLEETGGSRVQAAQLLQIGKTSLFEKIKKYGLEEGRQEEREDGEI